jgi:hypothetical protein
MEIMEIGGLFRSSLHDGGSACPNTPDGNMEIGGLFRSSLHDGGSACPNTPIEIGGWVRVILAPPLILNTFNCPLDSAVSELYSQRVERVQISGGY